jgi:hypothetical protein
MQAKPAKPPAANDDDYLTEGAEEIIAEYGGDAREAIRALLAQISYLELARNQAVALASFGYARRKLQYRDCNGPLR